MDKATVKLLLESYRPQDANDPIFAEALREVAADPELALWFEETQRIDGVIAAKFQDVPVPAEVREHILLGYQSGASVPAARRSALGKWIAAIAAVLVLGLLAGRWLGRPKAGVNALAEQAISFTQQMPALQFVCYDAAAVAGWVNEQPGAQRIGLTLPDPPPSLSMSMIGSSVVDWKGQPVVMVCLQDGKRMAMLYILDGKEGAGLAEGASETVQKADWVVRTSKTNGRVRVLTARGRPEDLDFQMPF